MSDLAPAVVTRYLVAADAADFETLAGCFTQDGAVTDEGRTYRGRNEIIGWRETLAGKWSYTSQVTGSDALDARTHRVNVHVEGDFPGGVADLTYRFVLQDGLIAELSIVE